METTKVFIKSTNRSCGQCTKCCEGYLEGEVAGHRFYAGKPCYFLSPTEKCTIYDNRPKKDCEEFYCEWMLDDKFPEWMKPENSGVIVYREKIHGFDYLFMVECGKSLEANILSWFVQYLTENKLNGAWRFYGGKQIFIGSDEFMAAVKR